MTPFPLPFVRWREGDCNRFFVDVVERFSMAFDTGNSDRNRRRKFHDPGGLLPGPLLLDEHHYNEATPPSNQRSAG